MKNYISILAMFFSMLRAVMRPARMRGISFCILFFLFQFSLQAQTTPKPDAPATPETESKIKFINKMGHWLAAYGMSGEEFVQDQRDSFKTAAFAEVYIECIIDYDTWLFNLLNRVTKLRNEEKQSPYIFFELSFKPKDETLTSYTIPTFTLKSSTTITGLDKVATDSYSKYLKGKTYAEPVQSIPDVEKAIKEVLNVLKEKLGNQLAPDLMVRYQNEFFWNGHEINILDTEGNYVELEAINKNIQPYNPNDIVWTNADPSGSKGVVDMTGVSSKTVSYKRKRDSVAMSVNVKRASLTDDVNEILKAAIIEALTYKKKEALDAVAQLKKDSIDNANNAALFIAQIESENFPMINDGTSLTPMFSAPLLRNDEDAFINPSDKSLEVRAKTFLELKKRKTIRKAIKLKINVAAFADLVVDHPQEIQTLLNALLENSGRLVAQLILGQTGEGKKDAARNIVVDFLNKNLESIVGNRFPDAQGEPPVIIPVTPIAATNPHVFSADKFLYINKYADFKGRDSLEAKLNNYLKGLDTALYVFINYSQDNTVGGFLARSPNAKPMGIPEGVRYKVFTILNMPGSLLEISLTTGMGCSALTIAESIEECVNNNDDIDDVASKIPIGDFILEPNSQQVDVTSFAEERVSVNKGDDLLFQIVGEYDLRLVAIADKKASRTYFWDDKTRWYKDNKNNEYDNWWALDVLNAGIGIVRPLVMVAGGDPDGVKRLKLAYANYDGNLTQFIGQMVKDGVVELVSDVKGNNGGYRKNQALLGVWLSVVPLSAPASGLVSTLSRQVAKYGIIVGGRTLKVVTFTTLLNIEIFRYSIENSNFIFKNALRRTGRALTVIYRMENVRYITDFESTVKQATIELVKDADGNIGWREIVSGVGGTLYKVALGSEELSRFAIDFRKKLPIPNHKGNVAVFEYFDNSGNLVKKAFTTFKGVASHSEELAIDFFANQNIPKASIKRIYSELEPCELPGHTCKAKLTENFPAAEKSFSYDYPGGLDNTIRAASVKQRSIDLKQFLK